MNTHTTRLFSYLQSASIYHRVSNCLQVTYYFGNKTWVKWVILHLHLLDFSRFYRMNRFFSLVHKYVRMNVLLVIQKRILCTSRGNNPVVVMKPLHTHTQQLPRHHCHRRSTPEHDVYEWRLYPNRAKKEIFNFRIHIYIVETCNFNVLCHPYGLVATANTVWI